MLVIFIENITHIRDFQDWEIGILTNFLNRITLLKINRDAEDRIRWQPTVSSLFD